MFWFRYSRLRDCTYLRNKTKHTHTHTHTKKSQAYLFNRKMVHWERYTQEELLRALPNLETERREGRGSEYRTNCWSHITQIPLLTFVGGAIAMRSHDGRHTKTRLSEDVASRTSDGNPVEISLHYTLVSLFSSRRESESGLQSMGSHRQTLQYGGAKRNGFLLALLYRCRR